MVLGEKARPRAWSDKAIQEGIEIRYFCGSSNHFFNLSIALARFHISFSFTGVEEFDQKMAEIIKD